MVHGLSCSMACRILLPRPGIEPVSPALAGGLLTTGPPGKSPRDASKHSICTGQHSTAKNYPVQNVSSAIIEKPCLRQQREDFPTSDYLAANVDGPEISQTNMSKIQVMSFSTKFWASFSVFYLRKCYQNSFYCAKQKPRSNTLCFFCALS